MLQELLKACRKAPAAGTAASAPENNSLFRVLPEDIQSVIRPYLDSKFELISSGTVHQGVVFGSVPDMPFGMWLYRWMVQMKQHMSGARLPNTSSPEHTHILYHKHR